MRGSSVFAGTIFVFGRSLDLRREILCINRIIRVCVWLGIFGIVYALRINYNFSLSLCVCLSFA